MVEMEGSRRIFVLCLFWRALLWRTFTEIQKWKALAKLSQVLRQPTIQLPAEDGDKPAGSVLPTTTLKTVLSSLNKMQFLRQRTLATKGNITKACPLRKFEPSEVEREMERILASALKSVKYEPSRAALLSKRLSETIRNTVKNMKFPRYKVVAMVTITSRSNQCMVLGSRCLWNTGSDSSATSRYVTDKLLAVATVIAMLKE